MFISPSERSFCHHFLRGGRTTARAPAALASCLAAADGLYHIHTDHLGSTSVLSDESGAKVPGSEARYTPFGDWRTEPTANVTDRGYTGHKHNNLGDGPDDLGLIYMNARYYLPGIGRFASADTIVPDPAKPQSLNRYSYVTNNPLSHFDPSGHFSEDAIKDYLMQEWGDMWESILNAWKADTEWWNMLYYAHAGDVLVAAGKQGTFGWRSLFYKFLGEGNDLLTGIVRTDAEGNPYSDQDHPNWKTYYYNNARLNDIFSGRVRFSYSHGDHTDVDVVEYTWGNVLTWDAGYPRWLMSNGWGGQVSDGQRQLAGYAFSGAAGAAGILFPETNLGKLLGFSVGAWSGNLLNGLAQDIMGAHPNDVQLETTRKGMTWHLIVSYNSLGQYTVRRVTLDW